MIKLLIVQIRYSSLVRILGIHHMPSLQLDWNLAFQSAFDRLGSYPSLAHSLDTFAYRDPLIYRSYSIVAAVSGYTSTTGDSCPLHAFLLPNKSHTRVLVPHLALLVPPGSMASVTLLPNSSRIQGSEPFRDPGLCIWYTTLLHAPLVRVPFPASNFASLSIGFVVAHGFVVLPT